MINSYIHNSSVMSTEDGSSSTIYGGPQPSRSYMHYGEHHLQQLPPSHSRHPLHDYLTNGDATSSAGKGKGDVTHTRFPGQKGYIDTDTTNRRSGSPRLYSRESQPDNNNNCNAGISKMQEEDLRHSPAPSVRALRTSTSTLPSPQQQLQQQQKALIEEPRAMLEAVLPVSTKLPSHEAQVRPLGVYVRSGRGGVNGVTRLVLVRLTDPADPFFLYELELLEDDYGAFKQRLELLVDFQGFPRYLVNMLRGVADGSSPYELSFVLHSAASVSSSAATDVGRGTLRVLETTEFKTVEHISLLLLRQGDAGLKKYLAERFQFYEQSFRSAEAARAAITAELQEQVEQLQSENDGLRDTLRQREEEVRFMTTDAEKEQLAALNRLRDQHTRETNALRESYEKKLESHTRALEEKTQELRHTTEEKDTALSKLRTRVSELEATTASLQSQLRSAQDTESIQAKELEALREMNDELANFKAEATKAMSENELNYVTLTERLRGTSTALQNREEKVAALQEHYEKQDAYIRILAEQNKQQADRIREAEKNLEKAHHIIANQLQAIRNAKDRYHIAADQLRCQEALLREREGTVRRHQDEVGAANERIQELLHRNNDLRDQLEKTNNAREQLVVEMKQTQQALLRLQQSTSINGRHWGVLSGGFSGGRNYSGVAGGTSTSPAGLNMQERYGTTASVPTDLMREFGANTNVARQTTFRTANGGGEGDVMPSRCAPMSDAGSSAYTNRFTSTAAAMGGPSLFNTAAHAAMSTTSPSPSPLPAHSSQERAGSSETAGLTEPYGRTSTSSLGKTESSPASSNNHNNTNSTAASRRGQPLVRSVSLEKPAAATVTASISSKSNNIVRSSHDDLAMKSFFNNGATQSSVVAGNNLQSAYF